MRMNEGVEVQSVAVAQNVQQNVQHLSRIMRKARHKKRRWQWCTSTTCTSGGGVTFGWIHNALLYEARRSALCRALYSRARCASVFASGLRGRPRLGLSSMSCV